MKQKQPAKNSGRVKVVTPDPWINTLGGALSVAADGIWEVAYVFAWRRCLAHAVTGLAGPLCGGCIGLARPGKNPFQLLRFITGNYTS